MEYSVTTYNYERQPNQDVQNIINRGPKKIVFRRQIKIARQRLVEINQAEPCVKEAYELLFPRQNKDQADSPEDDMKDIVGWGSAGETLLSRDKKPGDTGKD